MSVLESAFKVTCLIASGYIGFKWYASGEGTGL